MMREVVVMPGEKFPDAVATYASEAIRADIEKTLAEATEDDTVLSRENVLEEANRIAGADRSRDYGHPKPNHERIAAFWSSFLESRQPGPLQAREVALMMILLKVAREQHTPKRDNVVDIAGYCKCLEMIDEA